MRSSPISIYCGIAGPDSASFEILKFSRFSRRFLLSNVHNFCFPSNCDADSLMKDSNCFCPPFRPITDGNHGREPFDSNNGLLDLHRDKTTIKTRSKLCSLSFDFYGNCNTDSN